MLKQYSTYPFHVEVITAEKLVENLRPSFQQSRTLKICYPKLGTAYRNTEEIEENLHKTQAMIDLCIRSLDTIPPVLLKSPVTFWEGVRDIWIPWAFMEFADGRFPILDSLSGTPEPRLSKQLDRGLYNNIMLTPIRIIYPFGDYFENEDKARSERIKAAFNTALYDTAAIYD